jgi:enterochelin esterase-like enzyme
MLYSKVKTQLAAVLMFFMIITDGVAGSVFTAAFFSRELGRGWKYKVYLPDGYETSNLRYPVLYLLHGSEGDENGWDFGYSILDQLIAQERIPATIAIAPATGTSWWVDTATEAFESAFIKDLIPEVDKQYRTLAEREGRGLAGYSMGGYGAMRYALVYPEIFGASNMLSPAIYDKLPPLQSSARSSGAFGDPFSDALWTERNYPAALPGYFQKGIFAAIYIASGDDDYNHSEDFKFNIEQQATMLYGRLHKEGGSPAELRVVDGGHNTAVWQKTFTEGVQYMFEFLKAPETPVSVSAPDNLPENFQLAQNYPNPFNPQTTIQYQLSMAAKVTLKIHDLLGREIKMLVNKEQPPGFYSVQWNSKNDRLKEVVSGVYFYRLVAKPPNGQSFTKVRKLVLIK